MCVDLVLTGNVRPRFRQIEQLIDDYHLELGGSANIFASQFVKLGGTAGVAGVTGADAFGDLVVSRLASLGVDRRYVCRRAGLKTGLGVALAEAGDRAILTYLGTIDALGPEDLAENMLGECRHWHVASYFLLSKLRLHWPDWLQLCRSRGITVSLDTNWDPAEGWDGVRDLLHAVDVFLPNEAEALAISGEASVEAAGRVLAACGPLVVIKRGREGASVFAGGGEWHEPGLAPRAIVDATGAGDNFDAGFLRGWLLGRDIRSCVQLGQRCACASLSAAGGITAQLTERQ